MLIPTSQGLRRGQPHARARQSVSDGGVVLVLEVRRSTGPVLVRLFRFAGLFAVSPTIEALLMAAVWAPAVSGCDRDPKGRRDLPVRAWKFRPALA